MHKHAVLGLLSSFLVSAPTFAQAGHARYEVTFASTWSAATHPIQFPSNPHYSPLVGATHDAAVTFWRPGGIATPGVENMAETGSTSILADEVNAAISAGTADELLIGSGMGSPASSTFEFEVDASHSLLTLVTMLAPSPDWFLGIDSLDLMPNGVWVDDLTLDLTVWDAGTDSGTTYTSPNANIVDHLPIQTVTQASGPFQGAPLVVGTYHLRRLWSGLVYGCGLNPAGSMTFGGATVLGETVTMTLDDPTVSMPMPSFTLLVLSNSPWQDFPCGFALPGLGLDPGVPGELLVGSIFRTFAGADWNGSGVGIPITIPDDNNLIGRKFYLQGAMVAGLRVGLTDAVELLVGN